MFRVIDTLTIRRAGARPSAPTYGVSVCVGVALGIGFCGVKLAIIFVMCNGRGEKRVGLMGL